MTHKKKLPPNTTSALPTAKTTSVGQQAKRVILIPPSTAQPPDPPRRRRIVLFRRSVRQGTQPRGLSLKHKLMLVHGVAVALLFFLSVGLAAVGSIQQDWSQYGWGLLVGLFTIFIGSALACWDDWPDAPEGEHRQPHVGEEIEYRVEEDSDGQ